MVYSPTKPDAGPSPKIDVVQIQTNFSQFDTIFAKVAGGVTYNHTPLNNFNQGDHEAILFETQPADPGLDQDSALLYSKNAAAATGGPQPQIFAQILQYLPKTPDWTANLNNGMQLVYNQVNLTGAPNYQSFMPGSIEGYPGSTTAAYLLYFGVANNINASADITLVPTPTKTLVAYATPTKFSGGGNIGAVSAFPKPLTTDKITIVAGQPPANSYLWMAIAKS